MITLVVAMAILNVALLAGEAVRYLQRRRPPDPETLEWVALRASEIRAPWGPTDKRYQVTESTILAYREEMEQ